MTKFKEFASSTYTVKMKKPKKVKELNPDTLRHKTYKRVRAMITSVPPERRNLKNIPKYTDGREKVKFQDWMDIKGEKRKETSTANTYGKSGADGKWYGWSHRSVNGFAIGDTVKPTDAGSDNKEYTIKTDDQARQAAIDFAEEVS
jgi:hypothetical protein